MALRTGVRRQTHTAATETTPPLVAQEGEEVNDTRLIHALGAVVEAQNIIAELLGENVGDDNDRCLMSAHRALDSARFCLGEISHDMPCHRNTECNLPLGHDGEHR